MDQSTNPYPTIDYASHPGFSGLDYVPAREPEVVDQALARIDAALEEISKADRSSREQIAEIFRAKVDPELEAIRRHILNGCELGESARHSIDEAIPATRERLLSWCRRAQARQGHPRARVRESSAGIAGDLVEHGIATARIEPSDLRPVIDAARSQREELMERRRSQPEVYCQTKLPMMGSCWKLTEPLLTEVGVLAAASQYIGYPLEFWFCSVILSHPEEIWFKNCYDDVGLPTSEAALMHNDDGDDGLKVILYLGDVGPDQGPFGFIKGSHVWRRSPAQRNLIKCLDAALGARLGRSLADNAYYYRTRFKLRAHRRDLLALPRALQGTTHFGDDVLDGSELSKRLLEQETRYTSETANCFVFDGGAGIHRGGLVDRGERWAFQIGLRPRPRLAQRVSRSLRGPEVWLRKRVRDPIRAALRGKRADPS
jgi:hypothetical protein